MAVLPGDGSGRMSIHPARLEGITGPSLEFAAALRGRIDGLNNALDVLGGQVPGSAYVPAYVGRGSAIETLAEAIGRVDQFPSDVAHAFRSADDVNGIPSPFVGGLMWSLNPGREDWDVDTDWSTVASNPHGDTGSAERGDPVDTRSGRFVQVDVDVDLTAGTGTLQLRRVHAGADRLGVFGLGWASLLDVRLARVGGAVEFTAEDGGIVVFVAGGDGWVAPRG